MHPPDYTLKKIYRNEIKKKKIKTIVVLERNEII